VVKSATTTKNEDEIHRLDRRKGISNTILL